jgi:hypothetical protein
LLEGSLILFNLLLYLTLIETIKDEEQSFRILVKMIYAQQTDIAYDSVDFDDPASTLSYFTKLYLSFTDNTKEVEEHFKETMMWIIKKKTKEGSNEVRAQHIMRLAAEKIHGAFRELKRDKVVTTSEFVIQVILEAMSSLIDLMDDDDDDDDGSFRYAFRIRDHSMKDAGASKDTGASKGYEALG